MVILGIAASGMSGNLFQPLTAGDTGFLQFSGGGGNGLSYFNFATLGTHTIFANGRSNSTTPPIGASNVVGGVCNATRMVHFGGYLQAVGSGMVTMRYIDIATNNDGAFFGNLITARFSGGSYNDATRGIAHAGYLTADMEYITIATLGNALFFGYARQPDYLNGCGSSNTRGLSWGSQYGGQNIFIDYTTIATLGGANLFGNMSQVSNAVGVGASTTRCIGAGIYASYAAATNEFVTMATTGNSANFANHSVKRVNMAVSAKSGSILVMAGGYNATTSTSTMDYFTIAAAGAPISWGTLTNNNARDGACGTLSNCHGGL